MRRIIDNAHADATQLLTEHREQLDGLTHALLEAETLNAPKGYAAAGVRMRRAELGSALPRVAERA